MDYLSIAGSNHNYENMKNQDAVLFRKKGEYCVIALADGVSSCKKAKIGAKITCRSVTDFLLEHAERLFCMNEKDTTSVLLSHVIYCLNERAKKDNSRIEEYSSTLACVLFDRSNERMLYFSIGDSLITAVKDNSCYIVAMPSDSRNGCCVTTANNAVSMAETGIIDTENLYSVMICSDGAWHLMYRRSRMQPMIREMILERRYNELKENLVNKERSDDCSFIIVELDEIFKRRSV